MILLGQEHGANRQADHFFGLAFIDEDQFHAGPTGINDQTIFNRQGPRNTDVIEVGFPLSGNYLQIYTDLVFDPGQEFGLVGGLPDRCGRHRNQLGVSLRLAFRRKTL